MSFSTPTMVHNTSIAQKVQSRNAALKVKNGSPVLRELLRNKCRSRVKEHRYNFFNKMRDISEDDKKEQIDSIIRKQISEMDLDLQLQELIFQEIQEEAEQWLIDEFEREEEYLIQRIEESNEEVFCPLCQKSALQKVGCELSCTCGLRLSYSEPLAKFYTILWDRINDHGNVCSSNLTFFSEPKPDQTLFSLYAMCPICDYLTKIID